MILNDKSGFHPIRVRVVIYIFYILVDFQINRFKCNFFAAQSYFLYFSGFRLGATLLPLVLTYIADDLIYIIVYESTTSAIV